MYVTEKVFWIRATLRINENTTLLHTITHPFSAVFTPVTGISLASLQDM